MNWMRIGQNRAETDYEGGCQNEYLGILYGFAAFPPYELPERKFIQWTLQTRKRDFYFTGRILAVVAISQIWLDIASDQSTWKKNMRLFGKGDFSEAADTGSSLRNTLSVLQRFNQMKAQDQEHDGDVSSAWAGGKKKKRNRDCWELADVSDQCRICLMNALDFLFIGMARTNHTERDRLIT